MTRKGTTRRTRPRRVTRAKPRADTNASQRSDFGAVIDLIADAKKRGLYDPQNRRRLLAKPTMTSGAGAPFARIVADAKTEDQALRAFEAAAREEVVLPADAFVVGELVKASAIVYGGHPRAGLTLICVRGERHFSVNLADAVFPPASDGARFVSLYRAWLGVGELPTDDGSLGAAGTRTAASGDIIAGSPVELIVLACKSNALRCRLLGTAKEITLRTAVRDEVPGAILTVMPTKQWTHVRHVYLTGSVISIRADVEALGIVPLALRVAGEWDPEDQYWGEEGEPVDDWAKPIIARGKRPMFEMEQVIPGADRQDFDSDPIIEASELNEAGDRAGARAILMDLLARDLRCLDAHAHLGNFAFDHQPAEAQRHYEIGMSIGAFSLGKQFANVLPWGLVDNRPFLRCLHGVGLCAWRLGDRRTAAAVFKKMLWLNPGDNQGARFNLAAVEADKTWEEAEGNER